MSWFYNLKISLKLIIGFLIVALLAGLVGMIGLRDIKIINDASTLLYEENALGLNYAGIASETFQRIRFNVMRILATEDVALQNKSIENVQAYKIQVEEFLKLYEDGIISEEDRKIFQEARENWNNYYALNEKVIGHIQAGEKEQAVSLVFGEIANAGDKVRDSFGAMFTYNSQTAQKRASDNDALAQRAITTMIAIIIGAMLAALALGFFIARIISKPVNQMVDVANKLAKGDIDVHIETKSKDEIGVLAKAFGDMIENVRQQAEAAEKVAEGDFSVDILMKSDKDVLNMRLKALLETIKSLIAEMNDLYKLQKAGEIDALIDVNKFKGAYREVANGVNEGYNLHVGNILKILQVLSAYAEGDFSPILEKLPGKQATANEKMDLLRENLLNIINELMALSKGAVEGNLTLRGNVNKFQGDYKKILLGINDTLNATTAPIHEATAVLEEVSKGNLQVSMVGDYKGDHAIIKNALNSTIHAFNDVLGNINAAAEQVASGARQVSDSSMALSQGATEQASSVEELTASLDQISSQTRLNAENANQANQLAETAKVNAEQGNAQMKEMLQAMEEINESSTNISRIIKVIDEIAFQTNILALNAAVEAARAGQHGKGFAVVAEEVRNLAARSANAAKETTDMIEGSIKKTEAGTKIANETAIALQKIVEGVAKAASLVGDIAVASNEQALGVEQINQGVVQISQVVQSNSATSEESAAASEELSSQAELLNELVRKFKLSKTEQLHGSLSEINPEVLKMLESMAGKKRVNLEEYSEPAAARTKIILSDDEFGKY